MYPKTYVAVKELVRKTALITPMARKIVRRSGFRVGSAAAEGGRPPITVVRFEFYNLQNGVTYDTGQPAADQYTRTISRKYATTIAANATRAMAPTNRFSSHMTRVWLAPFEDVRVVARVITSTTNLHVIGAFGHPATGDWIVVPISTVAGFADTAGSVLGGSGSCITSLVAPISASTWQPIHASYKALGEVRAGLFIRNTSGAISSAPESGVIELQVR